MRPTLATDPRSMGRARRVELREAWRELREAAKAAESMAPGEAKRLLDGAYRRVYNLVMGYPAGEPFVDYQERRALAGTIERAEL